MTADDREEVKRIAHRKAALFCLMAVVAAAIYSMIVGVIATARIKQAVARIAALEKQVKEGRP